ncbi:MAG: hypothetical protein AB7O26_17800 [Planctomycetaceae bacterium]
MLLRENKLLLLPLLILLGAIGWIAYLEYWRTHKPYCALPMPEMRSPER